MKSRKKHRQVFRALLQAWKKHVFCSSRKSDTSFWKLVWNLLVFEVSVLSVKYFFNYIYKLENISPTQITQIFKQRRRFYNIFFELPSVSDIHERRGHLLGQSFALSGCGGGPLQDEDHSGSRPHSFPGLNSMRSGSAPEWFRSGPVVASS